MITLNKPFEVPVSEVKFVKGKKVVSKAVFYGYYLTDDVVFFACEGIGKFQYRFYLWVHVFEVRFVKGKKVVFSRFAKFPLFLVLQDLSPVEMEFRYGIDDDLGASEYEV